MKPLTLLLMLLLAAAWSWRAGHWRIPDRHNPWAPLQLQEPPNWLTRHKLQRLSGDAAQCRAVLAQAGWQAEPVPDRSEGEGCGWRDAVRVDRMGEGEMALSVGRPFVLSCPAAVSLALWERHALQPAAAEALGSRVRAIEHFGTYACRNVYGRAEGRRSQHASAQAIDIAGFVLADGRRVRVAADWDGDGAGAAFLRRVHRGACASFDAVLGPAYNAAHADHLHLDIGGGRVCR